MDKFQFLSEVDALDALNSYLEASNKVKDEVSLYEISAHPDTNEGRYPAQKQGYVLLRCGETESRYKDLFIMDFLFEAYGSPITFGMGNYSVPAWSYKEVKLKTGDDYILSSIISNLKHKSSGEYSGGYFAPPKLLAVIESPNLVSLKGAFIWLKWNHFTKKNYTLQQMLKR